MPTIQPAVYANRLSSTLSSLPYSSSSSLIQFFDLRDEIGLYNGISTGLQYPPASGQIGSVWHAFRSRLQAPFNEMAVAHANALVALRSSYGEEDAVVTAQIELVNGFFKHLLSHNGPTGLYLPLLYQLCRDLKHHATLADEKRRQRGEKEERLAEASRVLLKCFSGCVNDRYSDPIESRKMGTYWMATILFKTYTKLGSTALCKNIIKGIEAAQLPSFDDFPIADRVAYDYYMGVFAFLREDMVEAESRFLSALSLCYTAKPSKRKLRNLELILDHLTPILLLRGIHPSNILLHKPFYSRVGQLYRPFVECCRNGDVREFERRLEWAQKRLMQRGCYLVVEKAREGSERRLLKTAWILNGKPPRLSVEDFRKVYELGSLTKEERANGQTVSKDDVECLLANMIYNGFIKGYISHAHSTVVLSKQLPFPWYGPFKQLDSSGASERTGREVAIRNEAAKLG